MCINLKFSNQFVHEALLMGMVFLQEPSLGSRLNMLRVKERELLPIST